MAKTPAPNGKRARKRGVTYRPITDADMPLLGIIYDSTRAAEMQSVPWGNDRKREFLDMQFKAQHTHYQQHYPDAAWLIVEHKGEAVGRLYIEHWPTQHCVIDIAILPHLRGEGLGGAIMRDIMDDAKAVGKGVCIHVEKNNQAMNLYNRLGFKKAEDKGVYDLMVWRPD